MCFPSTTSSGSSLFSHISICAYMHTHVCVCPPCYSTPSPSAHQPLRNKTLDPSSHPFIRHRQNAEIKKKAMHACSHYFMFRTKHIIPTVPLLNPRPTPPPSQVRPHLRCRCGNRPPRPVPPRHSGALSDPLQNRTSLPPHHPLPGIRRPHGVVHGGQGGECGRFRVPPSQ